MLQKCFIGSYKKNRDSIEQRNDTNRSQKKVLQSGYYKISWDFPLQTEKTLEHNQSDIPLIDKKSNKSLLTDPTFPFETTTENTDEEKLQKFGK